MEYVKIIAAIISLLGVVITASIGFIKWHKTYKQSVEDKRYAEYIKLFKTIFGAKENDGQTVPMGLQAT